LRGESRLLFGCPNIRQWPSGVKPQIAGGNDMKSEDEIANDWIKEQIPWLKNPENLIPTVNPDDLKSLWKLQNDLPAMVGQPEPGHSFIVGREIFQRALSSGANLMDVYYRLGRLSLLQAWSEAWPLEFPWIHDGKMTTLFSRLSQSYL
jgi:hypothetical protein